TVLMLPAALKLPVCVSCATARAIWPCGTPRVSCSELRLTANEGFGASTCFVIGELLRRAFHKIAGRPEQRAANAAVESQLGAADCVNDDTRGIRRIPHLALQLAIEPNVAVRGAFIPVLTQFPIGP